MSKNYRPGSCSVSCVLYRKRTRHISCFMIVKCVRASLQGWSISGFSSCGSLGTLNTARCSEVCGSESLDQSKYLKDLTFRGFLGHHNDGQWHAQRYSYPKVNLSSLPSMFVDGTMRVLNVLHAPKEKKTALKKNFARCESPRLIQQEYMY